MRTTPTTDCLCRDSRFREYVDQTVEVFPDPAADDCDCEPSQYDYDLIMSDFRDGVSWVEGGE